MYMAILEGTEIIGKVRMSANRTRQKHFVCVCVLMMATPPTHHLLADTNSSKILSLMNRMLKRNSLANTKKIWHNNSQRQHIHIYYTYLWVSKLSGTAEPRARKTSAAVATGKRRKRERDRERGREIKSANK